MTARVVLDDPVDQQERPPVRDEGLDLARRVDDRRSRRRRAGRALRGIRGGLHR